MRALLEHKLRKGRHLGLDSSIIEATASLRELQHRNTKEDYWSYVKKLAAAAVINPVVHPAALAVHAQAHAITFEAFAPGSRRELTILIGVEDRRSPPPAVSIASRNASRPKACRGCWRVSRTARSGYPNPLPLPDRRSLFERGCR